ncbi:histidine phosphatase family protein [Deferrisoma palaeochoriense]
MEREPRPTRVFLVRHGKVENPGRVLYGRLPRFGLSPDGREQARRAAEILAAEPLAEVWASPLLRARQTAREILARHPGLRLRISRLLHEVRTPFEGRPLAEARAAGEDFYTGSGPGFEQPGGVADRMERFLRRTARRRPGAAVAAVTHGDPLAFLVMRLSGLPLDPRRKAALQPCGIPDGYPQPGSIVLVEVMPDGRARVAGYRGSNARTLGRWDARTLGGY